MNRKEDNLIKKITRVDQPIEKKLLSPFEHFFSGLKKNVNVRLRNRFNRFKY